MANTTVVSLNMVMASRLAGDVPHGADLPACGGSYLLLLSAPRLVLSVGKLGQLKIRDGTYVYVGSAHGPGGLRARVGRHLTGGGRSRWHVDYLRAVAAPLGALVLAAPGRWECVWAEDLQTRSECEAVRGFGASDCRCPAHLFRLPDGPPVLGEIMSRPAGSQLVWYPADAQ